MKSDGGPAFPNHGNDSYETAESIKQHSYDGMSLRAYAACKALQGIAANQEGLVSLQNVSERKGEPLVRIIAMNALMYADALIAELERDK